MGHSNLYAFSASAHALRGQSHLFADTFSAPDVAQPIELFWPLSTPRGRST